MKRVILVGAVVFAALGAGVGTAGAEGIPVTPQGADVDTGSAKDLGNAVGAGSVDAGSSAAALGSAFGGGYLGGVLSGLSSQ